MSAILAAVDTSKDANLSESKISNTKLVSKLTISNGNDTKEEETPSTAPSLEVNMYNSDSYKNKIKSPTQALTISNDNKENETKQDSDCEEEESESEYESSSEDEVFIGMTKEQIAQIKEKMGHIQAGFEENQNKATKERIDQIKNEIVFTLSINIDDELAKYIDTFITENNENIENERIILSKQLEDDGVYFLQSMKEMMAQQANTSHNNNNNNDNDINLDLYNDDNDSDEEWNASNSKPKKKKKSTKGTGLNMDGSKRCGRLLLNDALKSAETMEGWSEARKKAWKNRKTSPNAYFYRFNVPGQPQKNGAWSKAEHKLFMKRVMEMGVNDKWGIFSKVIPGRVGYVCSNHWKKMVGDGDVKDLNAYIDKETGKPKFHRQPKTAKKSDEFLRFAFVVYRDPSGTFTNLPMKHPNHPSDEYCNKLVPLLKENTNAKKGKKRKGNNDNDDVKPKKKRRRTKKKYADSDGDEEFSYKGSSAVEQKVDDNNPLPEFTDIITGELVVKPAISPYGHVLGYDTWTKVLRSSKAKNMCPFTVQKMSRRDLVKLTKDNFDEYKDKIVNITKEQLDLQSQMQ